METRSWRKWWAMLALVLLLAQGAIAATSLQDLEDRVLQAIARHADREAATALIEAWQQEAEGAVSPGSVALTEGLNGHYLTAKQLMSRVVADNSDDATVRLGSLVLVLLEGNPPTCRKAIEELALLFPENPHLTQRYRDVLESMGLPAADLPSRAEEPAAPTGEEPAELAAATPAPARELAPTPAPTAAPREIRPVQAESVREQLLRQLAEAQTRRVKEEEARQRKAKEEQARKRREEAARLAAEKTRREEAARLAVEERRKQEAARQEAERRKIEEVRLAREKARTAAERKVAEQRQTAQAKAQAERQARAEREQQAREQARQAQEQRRRLERAEQERWVAARQNEPSAPPAPPAAPPDVRVPTYVLKPVKIANRRVWIGEERASVHARLGRPRSIDAPGLERYAGLSVWYDKSGKVMSFEVDSAWFHGPGGVRPGLSLREVLRALPNSDGLFHLPASGPDATSSLYVLSTVDGTLAELQFNDEVWLSTHVRTTTPAGATHLYEELLKKGPVRRLAPDYVFALEARKKPLP